MVLPSMQGERIVNFRACSIAVVFAAIAAPAVAVSHSGTGTFSWTYAPQNVAISSAMTSSAGVVHGLTQRPNGPTTGTMCTDLDAPSGTSSGSCVEVDADGDKWMDDWQCTAEAKTPPGLLFACTGETKVTAGTGKYAKAKGGSTFTINGVAVLPDGTAVGYTTEKYDMNY